MTTIEQPGPAGSLLGRLLDPNARRDLVRSFPYAPLVHHGAAERIEGLFPPETFDVRALAGAFHDPVTAWFDDDADCGDQAPTPLPAPLSIAQYEAGALLQFNYIERWLPGICPWLRSLEDDLSIPSMTAHCQLFASMRGSGAKAHWDNDPVLTVQLAGRKTWSFAPQDLVRHPMHNHVCGTGHGGLGAYYQGPLPEGMPAEARVVELSPGSVLFVPRGYLHQTTTSEASISLAFDFTMPTWVDLACSYLRRSLERDERWREYGLEGSNEVFAGLLPGLTRAIEALRDEPELVLREANPPLLPGGALEFRRTRTTATFDHEPHRTCIELSPPGRQRVQLEVSAELAGLCRWVLEEQGIVTQRELLARGSGLERSDVAAILGAFVELDVLEPLPPSRAGDGATYQRPDREPGPWRSR
ncbi:MAG: cupin domain-containing protein [Nannocystaceae bacterium]